MYGKKFEHILTLNQGVRRPKFSYPVQTLAPLFWNCPARLIELTSLCFGSGAMSILIGSYIELWIKQPQLTIEHLFEGKE